jgi:hypothetical protein
VSHVFLRSTRTALRLHHGKQTPSCRGAPCLVNGIQRRRGEGSPIALVRLFVRDCAALGLPRPFDIHQKPALRKQTVSLLGREGEARLLCWAEWKVAPVLTYYITPPVWMEAVSELHAPAALAYRVRGRRAA